MNEPNVEAGSKADKLYAKYGWLFNQERALCCLKKWKRRWFVLDKDCTLRYYERPENAVANGLIVLRKPYTLSDSSEIPDIDPPQGCSKECLLKIETADAKMTLCSETPEEMRAWRNVFESIRGDCTAPIPVIHEVQILTPVIYLHTTTTMPSYVVQNADSNQTPVVVGQATTSQVGYQQVSTTPVRAMALMAPVVVMPRPV